MSSHTLPTEAELAAIREWVEEIAAPGKWAWEVDLGFVACARADVPRLLALVDHLTGVIHDMQQESWAYQRGVEDGKRWAVEKLSRWSSWTSSPPQAKYLRDAVEVLGAADLPDPLPPDQARAEVARLREALRRMGDAVRAEAGKFANETIHDNLLAVARLAGEALGEE